MSRLAGWACVVGDLITSLEPGGRGGERHGAAARHALCGPRARAVALERAWLVADVQPRIVPSAFGVHAGGVGAAAIALEDFVYTTERPHSPAE